MEHTSPALHACPHDPQFFGSFDSSTHAPEHDTSEPAHDVDGGRPHSPLMQLYPVAQSELDEQSSSGSDVPLQLDRMTNASTFKPAKKESKRRSKRMRTSSRTMTEIPPPV